MSDDQFTRLFTYMQDQFGTINRKLDETASKTQVGAIYDLLDKNIGEHQRQEEERAAMAHQLTRLDDQVKAIADKTGVTLRYE